MMAGVKQHEPPILLAWLAQLGFISVVFGPAILAGTFYGPSAVAGTFLLFGFTCLYVGAFVAYFRSKKAKIRINPMIRGDWTSKYKWNLSNIILYNLFSFLNFIFLFYFTGMFPLEWSLQAISIVNMSFFFGCLLGWLGIRFAGLANGDAEMLSEAV